MWNKIIQFNEREMMPEIVASTQIGAQFQQVIKVVSSFVDQDQQRAFIEEKMLTPLGQELLTAEEFQAIIDDNIDFYDWIKRSGQIQHKVNVVIQPK